MDDVDLAAETTMYYAPPPIPEKPDLRSNAGRAAAGLPPRAPRGSRTGNPSARKITKGAPVRGRTDYTPAITSLMHLTAFGLQFTSPVDAATVMVHSSNVATAMNELAQVKPEFARVLDKLVAAGPYGAVIAALVPMGAQIMANHKRVPVGMLGTVGETEILTTAASLMQQG